MSISVNRADAKEILAQAFSSQCQIDDKISKGIKAVINGGHKTYRYILITGLLGKATNENANPLVLQAKSTLPGAYDARGICHKVLVPFERDFLDGALGGSNEPYLNKPARFKEMDAANAVRGGDDKIIQDTVISILSAVATKTKEEVFEYLVCGLFYLRERAAAQTKLQLIAVDYQPTILEVYRFIQLFLAKSHKGESCALVVGALETLYYHKLGEEYEVKAHKVNQSGASSKETGDIDVFKKDKLLCAIEVKDKDFSSHDMEHAFKKMIGSGAQKGEFIFGINAQFDEDEVDKRIARFEDEGFYILFHHILSYSKVMLYKIDLHDKTDFIAALLKTAGQIKCKDGTLEWIHEVATALDWQ